MDGSFSFSELLHPSRKARLRLNRARTDFCMIKDSPFVSLGFVKNSLYTCCITIKDVFHKKMHAPAQTPVAYNPLEPLAKTFICPRRQKKPCKENFSTKLKIVEVLLQ